MNADQPGNSILIHYGSSLGFFGITQIPMEKRELPGEVLPSPTGCCAHVGNQSQAIDTIGTCGGSEHCLDRAEIPPFLPKKRGEHLGSIRGYGRKKSRPAYIIDGNGCWIWQGGKNHRGYGLMWDRAAGKMRTSHRVMYERQFGPIPSGMQLDHLCRNRLCCNPGHLEVVTATTNVRRGSSTRLTPSDVDKIRDAHKSGLSFKAIGRRFGISDTHARRIVLRAQWCDDASHPLPLGVPA